MNRIYQLTRREAQARGLTGDWDNFWERVIKCSRALNNQNCSPPLIKQTIQRLAAQVNGVEPIGCLLAIELCRRGQGDCMIREVYDWAAAQNCDAVGIGPLECPLLSFTLATTAKYVMELQGMTPSQRLEEKLRVEFAIFSGSLPWSDRNLLIEAAGELAVKSAMIKAASRLCQSEDVACLLTQENTLDRLYSVYRKKAQMLEHLAENVVRNFIAEEKQLYGPLNIATNLNGQ